MEVVERRARHALGQAQDRLHLVEGYLIALGRVDEVVQVRPGGGGVEGGGAGEGGNQGDEGGDGGGKIGGPKMGRGEPGRGVGVGWGARWQVWLGAMVHPPCRSAVHPANLTINNALTCKDSERSTCVEEFYRVFCKRELQCFSLYLLWDRNRSLTAALKAVWLFSV